jgi:branched chain amino acid efflux pump
MLTNDPLGFAASLTAMAVAAYATRAGGYWLIGHFPIGPRLRRMLDALPGVVIASIVAPVLVRNGLSAGCAVAAAMGTMIVLRNDFAAVVAGIAVAALARMAGL